MVTTIEQQFKARVYMNYNNPCVVWNIARGVIHTLDSIDNNSNILSTFMAYLLAEKKLDRFFSELYLDAIRKEYYPNEVSRLRGFFYFQILKVSMLLKKIVGVAILKMII